VGHLRHAWRAVACVTTGACGKPSRFIRPQSLGLLSDCSRNRRRVTPMSVLRWTNKSTRRWRATCAARGIAASHVTEARDLRELGLIAAGERQDDRRDAASGSRRAVSVHQPASESVSAHPRPGCERRHEKEGTGGRLCEGGPASEAQGDAGSGVRARFSTSGEGPRDSLRTYDVARDEALVNVGITHETAEFAVASIRRCWRMLGRRAYPPGEAPVDLRGRRRQQWHPAACLEVSPAAVGR
jgi:hypothetical protein